MAALAAIPLLERDDSLPPEPDVSSCLLTPFSPAHGHGSGFAARPGGPLFHECTRSASFNRRYAFGKRGRTRLMPSDTPRWGSPLAGCPEIG